MYERELFDEIEKAHPEVFNVLLQILDDGRMTDGHGRTVDFKNTIIIMTSNVGSHMIQEMGPTELDDNRRGEMEKRINELLRVQFKPEFLNRIDEIISFHNLSPDQIGAIVDIQIRQLAARLADQDIELTLQNGARTFLAEKGYDPVYGARPLKRAIQQEIENPLAQKILAGDFTPGETVKINVSDGRFTFM